MPVLREDSVLIMDGAIKLYRREKSRKWQAALQIDGQYIRISTGESDLDDALQPGIPVVTSDRTPWNAITSMKLGACLPMANTTSLSDRLNEISKWADEDWHGFQFRLDEFLLLLAQNSNSEDDHVAMFSAAT